MTSPAPVRKSGGGSSTAISNHILKFLVASHRLGEQRVNGAQNHEDAYTQAHDPRRVAATRASEGRRAPCCRGASQRSGGGGKRVQALQHVSRHLSGRETLAQQP